MPNTCTAKPINGGSSAFFIPILLRGRMREKAHFLAVTNIIAEFLKDTILFLT